MLLKCCALLALVALCCGTAVPKPKKHESHDPIHKDHYAADGEHDSDYDHEAVLGSKEEEDEVSKLSPEEAKERLQKLVAEHDLDHDGHITRGELTKWVMSSFKKLDNEEAADRMQEQDEDEDKHISWEEYRKKVYEVDDADLETYKKDKDNKEAVEFLRTLELEKKKFDTADLNKDHLLDKGEYASFLHPFDYPHMNKIEVDNTIEEHDTNKDGFLDLKEFINDENVTGEMLQKEKENFDKHDLNKDGKLNRQEVQGWILPDHKEAAETEADHLIKESDGDKDGKLSTQEIIDNHELWVGSHATNYGRHLEDEL